MGFGKDGLGAIIKTIENVSLGTLANNTAIKLTGGISGILQDDFRILKLELMAAVRGLTAGEGVNLAIGIADNELTVGEIGESIDATGPLDRNDNLSEERAMRPVWMIGAVDPIVAGVALTFRGEGNSPFMVWKKRWTFSNPEGWTIFIFNYGTALTTGATVNLISTAFGVWVT